MRDQKKAQTKDEKKSSTLASEPRHVQLAIDLIMLLEQHEIPADEALKALDIVTRDFKRKLEQTTRQNKSATTKI